MLSQGCQTWAVRAQTELLPSGICQSIGVLAGLGSTSQEAMLEEAGTGFKSYHSDRVNLISLVKPLLWASGSLPYAIW